MASSESPGDDRSGDEADIDNDSAATDARDDSDFPLTRRQAIAGGGLLALVGAGVGVSHVIRPARAAQPAAPTDELDENGWVMTDQTTETVLDDAAGPVNVEAIASSVQYEDEGLKNDIKETEVVIEYLGQTATETLGDYLGSEFEQSMGIFAASKIDLTPHIDELPAGIGRTEVMEPLETQAQAQFEQQLTDAGLEDVRQVEDDTFEIETGQEASFFGYRATFTFEDTETSLQGTTIEIPGDVIELAGYLAIWHNGTNALIAAGAHPNENYADTITDTVQGEELTISFDLDLSPAALRDEIHGYMRLVA